MGKTTKEFAEFTENNEKFTDEIGHLAKEVAEFDNKFDLPGNEDI